MNKNGVASVERANSVAVGAVACAFSLLTVTSLHPLKQ